MSYIETGLRGGVLHLSQAVIKPTQQDILVPDRRVLTLDQRREMVEGPVHYFIKGWPRTAIVVLLHGHEGDIKPFVEEYMTYYDKQLQDYLLILEASPSAARQGTKLNRLGHNVNRCFIDPKVNIGVHDPRDEEAQALMKIFSQFPGLNLFLALHMDVEFEADNFYV